MRVSQIQNLTWAADVVVLVLVVVAGVRFLQSVRTKSPRAPDWKTTNSDSVGGPRWPGERPAFDHIHTTPIAGAPPAPAATAPERPAVDPTQEFRNKLNYLSGIQFPDTPEMSLARISYDGKEQWIRPGNHVGPFRLVEFTLTPSKPVADPDGRQTPNEYAAAARLVFRDPAKPGLVVIDQPDPTSKPLTAPGNQPFDPEPETPDIKPGVCPEQGPVEPPFINSIGEWVIPDSERLWIETWGEKHVLPNLGMKPQADPSGDARGVRITQLPESKTPLGSSHGIYVDDVVRSINGVAVNSKEEILQYLRGDGRGLYKYVVVVETHGAERTVVYRVPRPVKASRD